MIELRWVSLGQQRFLQYRYVTPNVDASGALCPPGEMSPWKDVLVVDANDVAMEDLAAIGGLGRLP